MTKIKDLVTVQVENVFRFFPIDSERYELIVKVGEMYTDLVDCEDPVYDLTDCEEKVRLSIESILENFHCGAHALVMRRLYPVVGVDKVSILKDRARRCEASLPPSVLSQVGPLQGYNSAMAFLHRHLMGELFVKLDCVGVHNLLSTKDMED